MKHLKTYKLFESVDSDLEDIEDIMYDISDYEDIGIDFEEDQERIKINIYPELSGFFKVNQNIKSVIQSTDHNICVKLDGKLKYTLTSSQQTAANSLSIGTDTNTCSDSHSHTCNDAYFAEYDGLSVSQQYGTGSASDYENNFKWRTIDINNSNSISDINTSSNTHSHYFTPSGTIGNTGYGTAINIAPKTLNVNMFIYL
jgi:hypothetical protein